MKTIVTTCFEAKLLHHLPGVNWSQIHIKTNTRKLHKCYAAFTFNSFDDTWRLWKQIFKF